jgi:hypothetical protein
MATVRHPWRLVGLILAAVACFGCNMLSLPFFLMTGMDPKHEPKCKLAPEDKNQEVKVLILASAGLETRPEFLRVDRELANLLSRQLQQSFKDNKENVTLVSTNKVEKYKDEHPNWRSLDVREIGKHFAADYVISLEINALSMYEKGSSNTLYRGHADVSLKVVDLSKTDEDTMYDEEYNTDFPRTRGPIPVSDNSAQQFRQAFLTQLARELSWRFTAHPTKDDYTCLN